MVITQKQKWGTKDAEMEKKKETKTCADGASGDRGFRLLTWNGGAGNILKNGMEAVSERISRGQDQFLKTKTELIRINWWSLRKRTGRQDSL